MAVLGNRYDSHKKTRKYKLQDKKPQLAPAGDESRKKSIEMTIEPVELCISIIISPHFKASRNLFSFV